MASSYGTAVPSWCVILTQPSLSGSSRKRVVGMAQFDKASAEMALELLQAATPRMGTTLLRAAVQARKHRSRVKTTRNINGALSEGEYLTAHQAWLVGTAVMRPEVLHVDEMVARLRQIAAGTLSPESPIYMGS